MNSMDPKSRNKTKLATQLAHAWTKSLARMVATSLVLTTTSSNSAASFAMCRHFLGLDVAQKDELSERIFRGDGPASANQ